MSKSWIVNTRTFGSSCSFCKDAVKHILIVCVFKRASFQCEYPMDIHSSILTCMNSCFFLFWPVAERSPIISISIPTATPYSSTPWKDGNAAWCLNCGRMSELFDLVIYSTEVSYIGLPPKETILISPHMFKPVKKIVEPFYQSWNQQTLHCQFFYDYHTRWRFGCLKS